MADDSSLEFDLFEEMRRNLLELLVRSGRDEIEAERISLYVIQGVRMTPKLLAALARGNHPDDDVLASLQAVLDNAPLLNKARALLLGIDDDTIVH